MSELNLGILTDDRIAASSLRRKQVTFVILALVMTVINYLDRSTISIAAVHMRSDLGLTAVQLGALLSAWSFSYALCNMPAGYLVDRLGARYLMTCAIMVWSCAQLAGGLVRGYLPMLATRIVLGVAESPTAPTNAKMVSTWIPIRRRGLATAVYTSSTSLGPFLAPLLLTGAMLHLGWRNMFLCMGVAGIVFSIVYFVMYRDLSRAKLSDGERRLLSDGEGGSVKGAAHVPVTFARWKALFHFRTTWGLMIGAFSLGWVGLMFSGWLPLYLELEFHVSIAKTGVLAAIPFLGGIFGAFIGGIGSDWLERRGIGRVNCRKAPILVGVCGAGAATAVVGFSNAPALAIAASFCALFFMQMAGTAQWAAVTIFFPKSLVGSAITTSTFAAFLGATLSPLVTGLSIDITGSFRSALFLSAFICMLAGLSLFLLVKNVVGETAISEVQENNV
ncbi:MFS transporter [Caballeronia sp. LjRoot34]|uniref:MFS transporter n=1 Tax=Caballeronia sp. LjRoot34 TaxID=3342325 RepID=UPI003ECD90F3